MDEQNQASTQEITKATPVVAVFQTGKEAKTFTFRNPTASAIKEAAAAGQPAPIKRNKVTLEVPVLSANDLLTLLQSEDPAYAAARQLAINTANSIIFSAVRAQFDEQESYLEIDPSKVRWDELDYLQLAQQPTAGAAIDAELVEGFILTMVDFLTEVKVAVAESKGVTLDEAQKAGTKNAFSYLLKLVASTGKLRQSGTREVVEKIKTVLDAGEKLLGSNPEYADSLAEFAPVFSLFRKRLDTRLVQIATEEAALSSASIDGLLEGLV